MLPITHEIVRDALANYHNIKALAESPLIKTKLTSQSLWMPYETASATNLGIAIQALLDWGLDKLIEKNTKTALISYETLDKRYRHNLSVSVYAQQYDLYEQTIQKRRLAGTHRLASIFNAEENNSQSLEQRQQYTIASHYRLLNPVKQALLNYLSLLEDSDSYDQVLNLFPELDNKQIQEVRNLHLIQLHSNNLLSISDQVQHVVTQQIPRQKQISLHQKIARQFIKRQHSVEAATHFLKANAQQKAANIILSLTNNDIDNALLQVGQLIQRIDSKKVDSEAWARLKFMSGNIAKHSNDMSNSLAEYEKALSTRDTLQKARTYFEISKIYRHKTDYTAALMHMSMGKALLEHQNSTDKDYQKLLVYILLDEALIHSSDLLDFEEAHRLLNIAEKTIAKLPSNMARNELLIILCELERRWGSYENGLENYDETIERYTRARLYALEANDLIQIIITTYTLAIVYSHGKSNYEQALIYHYESFRLAEESGHHLYKQGNNVEIGFCLSAMGQHEKALECFFEAYEYGREVGNDYLISMTVKNIIRSEFWVGKINDARAHYHELCGMISSDIDRPYLTANIKLLKEEYPFIEAAISDRQFMGLLYLHKNKVMTRSDYEELTEVGKSMAAQDLSQLVEMGWCERHGRGRGVRYVWVERETKQP